MTGQYKHIISRKNVEVKYRAMLKLIRDTNRSGTEWLFLCLEASSYSMRIVSSVVALLLHNSNGRLFNECEIKNIAKTPSLT